jgi:hypothetical protein
MRQVRSAALIAVAVSLLLINAAVFAGEEDQPTGSRILESWQGQVKLELRKQAPDSGFIADAKSWEKHWKAFRGDEKLPTVDFTEHLIVVSIGRDPNRITAMWTDIDDKGNAKVVFVRQAVLFFEPKTCAYQFAMISRKGIKSINGKPIPANKPRE